MENPVTEIAPIIHALTQSPLAKQRQTIETYFTPSASFTHPFCRTTSFPTSRWLIVYIYRWYKILSPRIDLEVDSVAFDQAHNLLYVKIHQVFKLWFVPTHEAHVSLVTVLTLTQIPTPPGLSSHSANINGNAQTREEGPRLYYITHQEDLYQTSEFVKFVFPWGGRFLVVLWQLWNTLLCVLGSSLFAPVSWLEDSVARK